MYLNTINLHTIGLKMISYRSLIENVIYFVPTGHRNIFTRKVVSPMSSSFLDHQCLEPVPSVDNAYVTYNGTYYADTATVTCDTGYEYPDGSVIQTTQCLEVGDTVTWTPVPFSHCQSKAIAFENPFPWCFAFRKFPRCYYVHLTRMRFLCHARLWDLIDYW